MAQHTIEEAEAANIQLAGTFFRSYLAPLARRYLEVTTEAALSIDGTSTESSGRAGAPPGPQRNTVLSKWKRLVGLQSDARGEVTWAAGATEAAADAYEEVEEADLCAGFSGDVGGGVGALGGGVELSSASTSAATKCKKRARAATKAGDGGAGQLGGGDDANGGGGGGGGGDGGGDGGDGGDGGPARPSSSGAKRAEVRARCVGAAEHDRASPMVQEWLHPPKVPRYQGPKQEPFSDHMPPLVLTRDTIAKGCAHLAANDPQMAEVIARVGVDTLCDSIGEMGAEMGGRGREPSNNDLFDQLLRSITFTQISVQAGTAMLKRLANQVLVANARLPPAERLDAAAVEMLQVRGVAHGRAEFTPQMIRMLTPAQLGSGPADQAAGFSGAKVAYISELAHKFLNGDFSIERAKALDDRRLAAYVMSLKGIGDWCAGVVMCHFFRRAVRS